MTSLRGAFQAAALLLAAVVMLSSASAQNLPSVLPQSLIEQLNRAADQNITVNPSQSLPSPLDQVRTQQQQQQLQEQFLLQRSLQLPPRRSQLEIDYARRTGMALPQYGYDLFRTIIPSSGDLQNGAVADNYRLSIGDELVITLRGQVSRSLRTRIDREGRLVLPDLPPIPAAGRTFGEVQADLERAVGSNFINTSVFVSVGNVRQISVAVLGEAMAPGLYRMGGFASVLDALTMAGGIKKTGSLRRITLVRGNERRMIDLYAVTNALGAQPDLSIADGDRIVIPPIGRTVAAAGEVDRPGIYELNGHESIDAPQLLSLAGGPLRPAGNRYVRLALDAQGRDQTSESASPAQIVLRPGDILMVLRKDSGTVGSVRLDGHVTVPGIRSLAEAPDLRRLVSATTFLEDPYLLFGVLSTKDERTRARRYVAVDLEAVLAGRQNMPLKDGDIVIVLSVGDINYIGSGDVQAVLGGQYPPLLRQQIVTRNPRATYAPQQAAWPAPTQVYQPGLAQPSGAPIAGAPRQQTGQFEPQSPGFGQPAAGTEQSASLGAPQSQLGGQPGLVSGQQELQTGEQALLAGEQVPLAGEAGTFSAEPEQAAAPQQPAPGQTPPSITAANLRALRQLQICRGLQELASIVAASRPGRFANARFTDVSATLGAGRIENVFPCPPIFEKYPELLPLAVEHAAVIQGEVRIPGLYPVVAGVPLASAVTDAGGLTRDVDLRRVEITHFAIDSEKGSAQSKRELLQLSPADLSKIALSPGDIVRFNPVFTDRDNGPVLLSGEFRRPGFYDIRRGERLSQLIERAGGLTDEAYPYGAVFTRYRVKLQEQRNYLRAASQLESGLTGALSRASGRDDAQALVTATQQLVTEIRATPAVGRVVVEADPTVLEAKPQVDPIMEPGDSVFMPKRPFYVAVSGEVLNPTSLQFTPGASPSDYIKQAGGLTQDAEDDSIFVVLPNGQAQPVSTSFWNFTRVQVPPGSTIVVPKDLRPFDLTTFLRDSTQIISQLAISAASLAVLNNNSTR